jgi:transposase
MVYAMIIEERKNISTFIGIDIGKYFLDIYCSLNNRYYQHIPNDKVSIESLINDLKKIKGLDPLSTLVVIDLTGNYEVLCRDLFHGNGFINLHLADGKKINYFKKSKRHGAAKTDRIDSFALAAYGRENLDSLKFYETDGNLKDLSFLKALQNRRGELKDMLVQEKNRLQAPNISDIVKKNLEQTIDFLENRIGELEEETTRIVENNGTLKRKYDALVKQRGIGDITAKTLLAFLPELGTLSRSKIASLSGTAPLARDSGTIKGYRSARGTGRQIIKKTLFIVMLTQIRGKDSHLNIFYRSLVGRGKAKKAAIVACMRKFIIYLNGLLRKEMGGANGLEERVGIAVG